MRTGTAYTPDIFPADWSGLFMYLSSWQAGSCPYARPLAHHGRPPRDRCRFQSGNCCSSKYQSDDAGAAPNPLHRYTSGQCIHIICRCSAPEMHGSVLVHTTRGMSRDLRDGAALSGVGQSLNKLVVPTHRAENPREWEHYPLAHITAMLGSYPSPAYIDTALFIPAALFRHGGSTLAQFADCAHSPATSKLSE